MKQLLYLEAPTPDIRAVRSWLHQQSAIALGLPETIVPTLTPTPTGLRIEWQGKTLVIFTWHYLNTTYLKVFQWSQHPLPQQSRWLKSFTQQVDTAFPYRPPELPEIDLSQQDIFTALEPYYPLTTKYFQRIPHGKFDLQRVYWWERRWRESVKSRFAPVRRQIADPPPILRQAPTLEEADSTWDVVIIGGALGALNAAMLARLGYRVALVERIYFGRMNREWNISLTELQTLVEVGLLTPTELKTVIAREYYDNFNLFFSGNNPPAAKSSLLMTPTVLNIAMDCDRLLQLCGEKLVAAGGQIFERTEFEQAFLEPEQVTIRTRSLETGQIMHLQSRLLLDAMGTTSPIAQQIHGGQAFDSVCPCIGGVIKSGFAPEVWDHNYGEPLCTDGDISRGRQLIWELFPGPGEDITIYLFHYHQIAPEDPGSILALYEDFFTCLPDYRRCHLDDLEWRKATFGYIPGRFSRHAQDRPPGYDRVLSVGDAAALNSPLVFTGFGSLVRNLPRITHLLHTALQLDLLTSKDLGKVNAYQHNLAVTYIFARGMMVRPKAKLPPYWVNATLSTFFEILTHESSQLVDGFIKDLGGWVFMTRTAVKSGIVLPQIPIWVARSIGIKAFLAWIRTYLTFTWAALLSFLFGSWVPPLLQRWQPAIASRWPRLWHSLLSWCYLLTYGMGKPKLLFRLPQADAQVPPADPSPVLSPASK